MSYRVISADTKVEIVLKLFKGESPKKMEEDYNIPKKTMYFWKYKAIECMYQIFEHNPPGPKRKLPTELLKCDELSQTISMEHSECPKCKKGKLVKNGVYMLNSGEAKQRMLCKTCFFQITIKKK